MRHKAATLFVFLAALVLISCQGALQPLSPSSSEFSGSITVNAVTTSTATAGAPQLASYRLIVLDVTTSSPVQIFSQTNTTGGFTVPGLDASHLYRLHMDKLDATSVVMAASDDTNVANTIQPAAPFNYQIQLYWLTSINDPSGVLNFQLSWIDPPGSAVTTADATLVRTSPGTYSPQAWGSLAIANPPKVQKSSIALSPGSYTLAFTLKNAAGAVVAAPRYPVLIQGNQQTNFSVTLPQTGFTVPIPVSKLTYQLTNPSTPRVVLNWWLPDVNTADALVVFRSTDGGATFTRLSPDLGADEVTFTDPAGVTSSTHYQYKIVSTNSYAADANNAPASTVLDFTTGYLWSVKPTFPGVTVTGPSSLTRNQSGTFAATATVTDIVASQWWLDGAPLQTSNSPLLEDLVINASSLTPGTHKVQLLVTDRAGAKTSSNILILTVQSGAKTKVGVGNTTYWLRPDGTVWAWGINTNYQVGDGTTTTRLTPVLIASDITDIAAGGSHLLMLKADGSVWGVGNNSSYQLAPLVGTVTIPTQLLSGGFVAIDANEDTSFALKGDGSLWAVGDASFKVLGMTGDLGGQQSTWTVIATDVKQVVSSWNRTVILKKDGLLYGTGFNPNGELVTGGTGTQATFTALSQANLAGHGSIAGFDLGQDATFVVMSDGSLFGGGSNANGALGASTTLTFNLIMSGIRSVSSGSTFTIAVATNNTVWGTGVSSYGALADGSNTRSTNAFQAIPAFSTDVESVFTGTSESFFVKKDGSLWAAGRNAAGTLGIGSYIVQNWPVQVETVQRRQYFPGYQTSFYLKPDQTLWASGINFYGTFGDGTTTDDFGMHQVATNVVQADSGFLHTLVLLNDGRVKGAGLNNSAQLGAVGSGSQTSLVDLGVTGIKAIAAGDYSTYLLRLDGQIMVSGANSMGQLGLGNQTDQATFIVVPGMDHVVAIAASVTHAMALKSDGTLWTTGSDDQGELGNNSGGIRTTFQQVLSDVAKIARTWKGGSVALKTDGTLWVSGRNEYGELGLGSTNNQYGFAQVTSPLLRPIVDISAGWGTLLVRLADQTLWATGDIIVTSGQFGNGTGVGSTHFMQIDVGSEVVRAAAGGYMTVLERSDGSVWTAGSSPGRGTGSSAASAVFQRINF